MNPGEYFQQATMPCWRVFHNVMTPEEVKRELRYRYDERLAILRDGAGEASVTEKQMAWVGAAEMKEKIKIYLL